MAPAVPPTRDEVLTELLRSLARARKLEDVNCAAGHALGLYPPPDDPAGHEQTGRDTRR